MKKSLLIFIFIFFFFGLFHQVLAQNSPSQPKSALRQYACPEELEKVYQEKGESCAKDYQDFLSDPIKKHFWTDDEETTTVGRAKERARQFIFWVMNNPSIDNHPTLLKIWSTTRNVAYFFTILVAAFLGLAIIIGQKTNYEVGIKIWPSITKILLSLLYISFSATLVISIVQLSDILMKFFIEGLGGKDLFNVYFNGISQESNYNFYGIKDLNYAAQESIRTQFFSLKVTEIVYYLLGIMLILRKIILWFLLFVAPFLAILLSFSITKNIGIIWIGVFFQWVFYGPLLSLFLGALATIWKTGIPYPFDFSRTNLAIGYVYPTASNILWGGPAQKLSILNNVNYIDPFAEYIISLVMLGATIFFPWWLLRSFRDYCCEGINAIKNLLMSNFGPGKILPPTEPSLPSLHTSSTISNAFQVTEKVKTRIETVEEIKKAKTEEIVKSLDIKADKLTDVFHLETNKQTQKNINYLKNPTQAVNASERQKYMNIRVEISQRALKADPLASRLVNSIFTPPSLLVKNSAHILTTLPKQTTTTQVVAAKVKLPEEKISHIASAIFNTISKNEEIIDSISQKTQLDKEKTKQILTVVTQSVDKAPQKIIDQVKKETQVTSEKTVSLFKNIEDVVKTDERVINQVASQTQTTTETVKQVAMVHLPLITEPEKQIEETIVIPQTVSIDEYEQVKKMWQENYEKGEIPISENIKTREEWVEKDIVLITNTLNKLYSSDETIKKQGLEDINYILPIFMINNLNGEQLVTYLKAKLEAAKIAKKFIDKEKEITEKLKKETERLKVEVPNKQKKEKAKYLEESLSIDEKKI